MTQVLEDAARALGASSVHALAVSLLSHVPGFPPIVQTVHILSVAAIMGSSVMVDLRIIGLAVPSQPTRELVRRVMPWTWWALPLAALSGFVFFAARPESYVVNPVFRIKFAMIGPAIALAFVLQRASTRHVDLAEASRGRRAAIKSIAALSLLLWVGVVLAGRWDAYADYLFAVE